MQVIKTIPSFIEHNEVLSSTNDRAWEILFDKGAAACGAVVTAGYQENGRGRSGRSWSAPKDGSLLMSLVLVPAKSDNLQLLPLASGLAVVRAIKKYSGIETRLKWPNDILFGKKKMGGILVESKTAGSGLLGVVIGIGINLRGGPEVFPDELRPTAITLEMAGAKSCERAALLDQVLAELNLSLPLCFSSPEELSDELSHLWAHGKGDMLQISSGESILEGRFVAVGVSGELVLAMGPGENKIIQGEILRIGDAC
jgi:BirA family transcriptional regulator, biotin operon repressor / biotin---[acetyl-CoA-carboxylase] ligase